MQADIGYPTIAELPTYGTLNSSLSPAFSNADISLQDLYGIGPSVLSFSESPHHPRLAWGGADDNDDDDDDDDDDNDNGDGDDGDDDFCILIS